MSHALGEAVTSAAGSWAAMSDSARGAPETERILDAALSLFGELGIKRTTIGDVARRAGIDRVTVYRRAGNKDELIQAVTTREATRMFDEVAVTARLGTTLAERIELVFASMMEQVRDNAMLAKLLQVEPDTVLIQLTIEGSLLLTGATLATMEFFGQAVEDGLLDSVEGMEPGAELLVRVVHSYILTPKALIDLETREQLCEFARTYLTPIVLRGRTFA